MTQKRIRAVGALLLVALWLALTGFSWFGKRTDVSLSERRPLAQMPELTADNILSGKFMQNFEAFTQDQYPLRDSFRQMKAMFLFHGLQQMDNDGYYIYKGYLDYMDHQLDPVALEKSYKKMFQVYELALSGRTENIYFSIVPDKNYSISQESGHLALDIPAMERYFGEKMPWAEYIDIKGTLTKEDYYRTDTHWSQDRLIPTAAALCNGMGAVAPQEGDFTVKELDVPFYGVRYKQVMMPVAPDTIKILQNDLLDACTVTDYGGMSPVEIGFHDLEGLHDLKDPYDLFLYGFDSAFVVIENPNAATDKELFLFRDSFGCSMSPLLVENYSRITVIDLRSFTNPAQLAGPMNGRFWNLKDADVLFLFSSLVLNNPDSFK